MCNIIKLLPFLVGSNTQNIIKMYANRNELIIYENNAAIYEPNLAVI